jgi:polar amino acid transport system permease protein
VVALMRTSGVALRARRSTTFVQIFQGTPLLLQLFLIFFGAPVLGWTSTRGWPPAWRSS